MAKASWIVGAALALVLAAPARAQAPPAGHFDAAVFASSAKVQPKVVTWRRDVHAHPELGNSEFRTSAMVAKHLKALGFEVRTGVAKTGVIGVLTGGRPGGVVALRADMDGLPVTEQTGVPFASKVVTEYNGQKTGVMHACGHDAHVAILMGAAEVLAGMRERIPGTVMVIFQPAEEGPPVGEDGGARLMVKEGALSNPAPSAIFGLHVVPGEPGELFWRPGPMMAASDRFAIALKGKQTHGANPWLGIDIVSMAADIVQAFNQIAARQLNVARTPTVLTLATIHGGVRYNIIPDDLNMEGTLRTYDPTLRKDVMARADKAVASITERYGGQGAIAWGNSNPVTNNDPVLTAKMTATLSRAARGRIKNDIDYITGAEDFSYYQQQIPGLFYNLGIGFPPGTNHSPLFNVMDEGALEVGVRAQALSALDYLASLGKR